MKLEDFLTPFSIYTEIVLYKVNTAENIYAGLYGDLIDKELFKEVKNYDVINVKMLYGQLHIDIYQFKEL